MKASDPEGLDIDLIRTPFPGKITVEIEGQRKWVVDPRYSSLAEGIADAYVCVFGKSINMPDLVGGTKVIAIDTNLRYLMVRIDKALWTNHVSGAVPSF